MDGTPMIYQMLEKLNEKINNALPLVMEHMQKCELDMMTCFGHHFFTLFLYNVPKTFAKRLLDLFLFEGENMVYSILINMLKICQ